jgi:hypothetical protein
MDSDFWIYLAFGAWALAGLVRRIWAESSKHSSDSSSAKSQPSRPLPVGADRERAPLEMAKGNFVRLLEEARRHTAEPYDPEEERNAEQTSSLEAQAEVVSLEQEVRRAPRREFTQDEDAENLVQRRILAATARDSGKAIVDHRKFDPRISKEQTDHTATRAYDAQQLRHAVVWREILGPPVSLRDQ